MLKTLAAARVAAAAALVAVAAFATAGTATAGVIVYDKTAKVVAMPDTSSQKVLIPAIKVR